MARFFFFFKALTAVVSDHHILSLYNVCIQTNETKRNEDRLVYEFSRATVYRNPRSVISTFSADPIQRMLLHLSSQVSMENKRIPASQQPVFYTGQGLMFYIQRTV